MLFASIDFQPMIGLSALQQSILPIELCNDQMVQRNEFSKTDQHTIASIYIRTLHTTYIAWLFLWDKDNYDSQKT